MSLEHLREELSETTKTAGWVAHHRNLLQTEVGFFRSVPPLKADGTNAKVSIAKYGESILGEIDKLFDGYLRRIGELVMAVEKLEGKYERDRT